jgi:hypothetical protein
MTKSKGDMTVSEAGRRGGLETNRRKRAKKKFLGSMREVAEQMMEEQIAAQRGKAKK